MASQKLGFWTASSLVVGNMIGSGIFLLPASLAFYGSISIIGWLISAIGAIALAYVFIECSKIIPAMSGGPYTYVREGIGDFAGFLVAWGYWASIWCTNAAIAVAFVSYLSVFIPALADDPILATIVGMITIWLVTWINTRGIREAGIFQLITSILKITPLIAIGLFGIFYISLENLSSFNISGVSDFRAIIATITLTFFAYLGIECAAIPAADVKDPQKTIPKATYFGLGITALVYILGSIALMGIIPPEELRNSNAPFADGARAIWGDWAQWLVAFGAIISTLGALNGWTLIQGQIPAAIARDGLFPKIFKKLNSKGTPAAGLVISSILVSVLMLMNYTRGLAKTFEFAILIATMLALFAYLLSSVSYAILISKIKGNGHPLFYKLILTSIAFIFSLWAIAGSGEEIVYWGFILLIAGLPFYVWILAGKSKHV